MAQRKLHHGYRPQTRIEHNCHNTLASVGRSRLRSRHCEFPAVEFELFFPGPGPRGARHAAARSRPNPLKAAATGGACRERRGPGRTAGIRDNLALASELDLTTDS